MSFLKRIQRTFKKYQPTIDWVQIDNFKWEAKKKTSDTEVWQSPDFPALLSKNFFDAAPDIPSIKEIEELRKYYRQNLKAAEGGLIKVELTTVQDLPAIETIFKIPNAKGGTIYLGSYTIPFKDFSFVIKIQAQEIEMTGKRSSYVLNHFVGQKVVKYTKQGMQGWSADPYDEGIKEGLLMNLSERPEYDLMFREHPLSKVREIMYRIKDTIVFDPQIMEVKRF